MPVEVLEAEIVDSAPYIEGLDNSVGGQIEVYTPPIQQAPAAKYGNTIPSQDRGLDGLVDAKGRPLTYRDDNGVERWNRDYEFDDIPDYGTPDFNDWANGADLDPEAFDRYVDRQPPSGSPGRGVNPNSLPGILGLAFGAGFTDPNVGGIEGIANYLDDYVPYADPARAFGGFLGAQFGDFINGLLGRQLSPDGLPIMAPGESAFTGGQCAGTFYSYSLNYTRATGTFTRNDTHALRGPVIGPKVVKNGQFYNLVIVHGGGSLETTVGGQGEQFGPMTINSFNLTGSYGPDICGDPAPELAPAKPGTPTITRPPDAPPIPGIEPDFPPTPEINTPPVIPELDTPPETIGDPPIEPIRPQIPEIPSIPEIPEPETEAPPETEQPPGQDGPPGNDGECCDRTTQDLGALRERLDRLLTLFSEAGAEDIDRAPCGSEQSQEDAWRGAGFTGVYRGLETLSRAVEDIWTEIKCGEDAIAIPEWWAVRPGADVPQLAITFKAEESNSKWSLTIPHYNQPQTVVPQVPKYDKGSIFATLTLKDNTKLTVNAKTFEEGERVIYALVGYIDPAYLPNPLDIHQGRRKGAALKEVKVRPTRGYFYATGQQDSRPDWVTDIEVI